MLNLSVFIASDILVLKKAVRPKKKLSFEASFVPMKFP